MNRVIILDCEAVQALTSPNHPHHGRVVAHVQVVANRKLKAESITTLAPTAVRVEANLDRASPAASFFNSLRIKDAPLDGPAANRAAQLHERHHVSVADAHVGASIAALDPETAVTVISSDPHDMRLVSADTRITIVRL